MAAGVTVDPDLPAYAPQPVALPPSAAYRDADGAVSIVGYNDMREWLVELDARFTAAHPGIRFALDLRGTRAAPAALISGRSALAPMGAEFSPADLAAFRKAVGRDPIPIRVAHAAVGPRAKSGPVVILVHPSNPLARLTTAQVRRLFTIPADGPPLRRWSELGVSRRDVPDTIRPVGLSPATALALFMAGRHWGGRPFVPGYEGYAESAEVVRRVSADPSAVGFAGMNLVTPRVKVIAVAPNAAGPYSRASADDVVHGRYVYDRFLYLYVRRAPGAPLDPLIADYLRLALSREGQAAVAATPQGYLPLTAAEARVDRERLDLP
jgi:phosphate transport system substrate-binding protein